jgi:hypothetical protein
MEALKIEDTTVELLRVAVLKSNKYDAGLAKNYSVMVSLTYLERLTEICVILTKTERSGELTKLFDLSATPKNFLVLAAGCLRGVQEVINKMIKQPKPTSFHLVTDYDGHAVSALGLCFSDSMWPGKAPGDALGPPLDECLTNYRAWTREQLWELFTKHYLGNILQYYFEKAGLRRDASLRAAIPVEFEEELRETDAGKIAQHCIATLESGAAVGKSAFDYIDVLSGVLQDVVESK